MKIEPSSTLGLSFFTILMLLVTLPVVTENAHAEGTECVAESVVGLHRLEDNGLVSDFFVDGTNVYVSDWAYGFRVYDMSNPESPVLLASNTDQNYIRQLLVKDETLYTAGASGNILIYDISTPSNPVQVGALQHFGNLSRETFAVSGSFLYISELQAPRLYIYDISDPASPIEHDWVWIDDREPLAILSNDNFLCVVDGVLGEVSIYSLIDPLNPTKVLEYRQFYGGFSNIKSFTLEDSKLYFGYTIVSRDPALAVFDLSDPKNPYLASETRPEHSLNSLYPDGDLLYYSEGNEIGILDFANPESVSFLANIPLPAGVGQDGIVKSGLYTYASTNHGIVVIDMDRVQLVPPPEETVYQTARDSQAIRLSGPTGYISSTDGLEIVDLSIPQAPVQVGFHEISPPRDYDLSVSDNRAYLVSHTEDSLEIEILDVNAPASVQQLGFYEYDFLSAESRRISGVKIQNDTVYVLSVDFGDDSSTFYAFDVTDPTNVSLLDSISFPSSRSISFDVSGVHVYITLNGLTSNADEMAIVDISIPDAMQRIETDVFDIGQYYFVRIKDSLAYVSTNNGTQIFDISIPENPVYIEYLAGNIAEGNEVGLVISGDTLFAFSDIGGGTLNIYDIAHPVSARWTASHNIEDLRNFVRINSHLVFVDRMDPLTNERNLRTIDISSCSVCQADLNNDYSLDFFDVSTFLTAFAAFDQLADFNGDGNYDFFDVSAFLSAYSQGCS